MITTSDGGYLISGYTSSNNGDITDGNNGSNAVFVIKLDNTGQIEWNKTYGGTGDDRSTNLITTSDGDYLISGYTSSNNGDITDGNNGSNDVFVIKLDNTGQIEWNKTYGGTGDDRSTNLITTSDGGYLISGITASKDGDITDGNKGLYDAWILKIDSSGILNWNKTYGGTGDDSPIDLITTSDGGYLIGGVTNSNDGDIAGGNKGLYDAWILKIDSSGILNWNKTYGGSSSDRSTNLITISDGGYLISGITNSNDGDITDGNNGSYDSWLFTIDKNGNY
ncbi:MAG: hypothetical protein PHD02_02650 [Bacilli bacterium]|nr:hypothetical protein [Bacilli bacterium]